MRTLAIFSAVVLMVGATAFGQLVVPAQSPEAVTVESAEQVLNDIMAIPFKSIPQSLLSDAQGIAIVPGMIKAGFVIGVLLLGIGTAMVYPTLLAAIGDVAHPSWRASAVGVYRLWRDLGYAIGALLAGLIADAFGLQAAMWFIAALTFASGTVSAARMTETLPARPATRSNDSPRSPRGSAPQQLAVDVRRPE